LESAEKQSSPSGAVVGICAEGIDSEEHSKDDTLQESRRVARVWRDVEMQVGGLLIQGGGDATIGINGNSHIHKVHTVAEFTDFPFKFKPVIIESRFEAVPGGIGSSRI
jgi:hypothetical protein